VEKGNAAGLVKLIQGVFEELLGLLLLVHHDPRRSVIKISQGITSAP
jgi:hypothetical protein